MFKKVLKVTKIVKKAADLTKTVGKIAGAIQDIKDGKDVVQNIISTVKDVKDVVGVGSDIKGALKSAKNISTLASTTNQISSNINSSITNQNYSLGFSSGISSINVESPQPMTQENTNLCPHCNNIVDFNRKFCIICGGSLFSEDLSEKKESNLILASQEKSGLCPHCNNIVDFNRKFCIKCGGSLLSEEAPSAPSTLLNLLSKKMKEKASFCPECGQNLNGALTCPKCNGSNTNSESLDQSKEVIEDKLSQKYVFNCLSCNTVLNENLVCPHCGIAYRIEEPTETQIPKNAHQEEYSNKSSSKEYSFYCLTCNTLLDSSLVCPNCKTAYKIVDTIESYEDGPIFDGWE